MAEVMTAPVGSRYSSGETAFTIVNRRQSARRGSTPVGSGSVSGLPTNRPEPVPLTVLSGSLSRDFGGVLPCGFLTLYSTRVDIPSSDPVRLSGRTNHPESCRFPTSKRGNASKLLVFEIGGHLAAHSLTWNISPCPWTFVPRRVCCSSHARPRTQS